MDAKKIPEVEMKELTTAEVQHKDAKKGKMEETKAEKKSEEAEAKKKKAEANVYSTMKNPTENIYSFSKPTSIPKHNEGQGEKDEEGEETNEYCKLKTSSENVYMASPSSAPKQNKDISRRVHLYKRSSAVFIILSLLLLAAVLALAMKLYEVKSSQKCPALSEVDNNHPSNNRYQCSECGNGWLKFENSCYLLSNERQTWQKSRETCQKMGGDLVVFGNEHVQKFLTENGRMLYWIGLRYSENQQWMWVNKTTLTRSYWANNHPRSGSHLCAILKGLQKEPVEGSKEQQELSTEQLKNWHSYSCTMVSHYICQKG